MAKKKQHKPPPKISLVNFIKTKARKLPLYKCYINSDWIDIGLASILVVRQHQTGNFTIGIYFIHTYEKGLFLARILFNQTKERLDKELETMVSKENEVKMKVEIDYTLAHNIIYRSIEAARKKGYSPEKEFEVARYILEEDDDKIEKIEISFEKSEALLEYEKELEEEKALEKPKP